MVLGASARGPVLPFQFSRRAVADEVVFGGHVHAAVVGWQCQSDVLHHHPLVKGKNCILRA
uniref:Uncharacterized protein n=1 Tax=Triticum urartu TaxID=4572 RepID=A0A8R7R180_TRIUA